MGTIWALYHWAIPLALGVSTVFLSQAVLVENTALEVLPKLFFCVFLFEQVNPPLWMDVDN